MPARNEPPKISLPMSDRALNNLRNGSRAYRLALGELPKRLARVTRYCRQYRLGLEQAVAEANSGNVTITQAHNIDAACGHEQHLQIMRWLMRERIDKMSVGDIVKCSAAMAAARDSRNRAVERLGLDKPVDPWATLDAESSEPEGEDDGQS